MLVLYIVQCVDLYESCSIMGIDPSIQTKSSRQSIELHVRLITGM